MAIVQIPDELDTVLQEAAQRHGRTKDELAEEILLAHLADESLPLSAFTEVQLERLIHGVEQVKRGELIPGEVIDAKFEVFFAKLSSR